MSSARGRMMVTWILISGEDCLIYRACPRYGQLLDVRKELEINILEWMVQGHWKMMWEVLKKLLKCVKGKGESRSS